MAENTKRIQHEIEHGKKISENAEDVWNWSSPAGQLRANRRADYLIKMGNFLSSDKILEIGCGTGLFTEKVFNATHACITAIDISEELLEHAREKMPDIEFKQEDAMNLTFPDNNFEGVFGSSIIHHLDMEKAIKEIYRVLKPGGSIVFAEPNMLNPQIFVERNVAFVKKWLGVSPDETAIIRWSMARMLKENGFKNVRVFPYDFLHPHTPVFMIGLVNFIGRTVEKIPLFKEIAGSVIIYGKK